MSTFRVRSFASRTRTCQRIARVLSLGTAILGSVSLLQGWFLASTSIRILPPWVRSKPSTALSFVFIAVAIWTLVVPSPRALRRTATILLPSLVALNALAVLFEFALGLPFNLEKTLATLWIHSTGPIPDRMTVITAAAFLCLSVSLLLDHFHATAIRWLSEVLALAVVAVGVAGVLGHIYSERLGDQFHSAATISPSTAALFVLMGVAGVMVQTEFGVCALILSHSFGGTVVRRILPAILVLPPLFGGLYLHAQSANWLSPGFGLAIVVTAGMVTVAGIFGVNAAWLNRSEEQHQREARFHREFASIVASTREAILSKGLDGTVLSWNHGAEALYGYSAAEIVGRPVATLIPDYLQPESEFILTEVAAGRQVIRDDTIRMRKDGTLVAVSMLVSPIFDRDNQIVGASAIAHDITKRKRAEETLRHSEERFSKAFKASPFAMTISTLAQGRYVDANDAAQKMLGYLRSEMIGHTAEELHVWISPDDRAKLVQSIERFGHLLQFETQIRNRQGKILVVEISAELISLNEEPCILGTFVDVTESRNLQRQFLQSQKMEAVGRIAGGIAHDFNNLLAVILGFSDLALDRTSPEAPAFRPLKKIVEASHRAALLTRQLLAFSRQQVLQLTVFNPNQQIKNFREMLQRVVREDIDLKLDLDPAVGNIKADPAQIEQVLMNLVVNARDAITGAGSISIATSNRDLDAIYSQMMGFEVKPGSYVRLCVSDTGSGMDSETLERIFDPFFTTKPVGKGTGLGLPTVYGIVKQSGGYIFPFSTPGKGTKFDLYFPRVEVAVETSNLPGSAVDVEGGSETILLAEDDEGLRDLTATMLKNAGYKVLAACDGLDALQMAKTSQQSIDLLITDVVMPRMVGTDLVSLLREQKPDLKVLFISGYAANLMLNQGTLEAECQFLQKPFTRVSLLGRVRQVLAMNRRGSHATALT